MRRLLAHPRTADVALCAFFATFFAVIIRG
jgi:hypothetical protein